MDALEFRFVPGDGSVVCAPPPACLDNALDLLPLPPTSAGKTGPLNPRAAPQQSLLELRRWIRRWVRRARRVLQLRGQRAARRAQRGLLPGWKMEAAAQARVLQLILEADTGRSCFIDSDHLVNLDPCGTILHNMAPFVLV